MPAVFYVCFDRPESLTVDKSDYNFKCEWRYSVYQTLYAVQLCSTQNPSHFVQIRRTCNVRVICRSIYLLRSPLEKYTKYINSTCRVKPVILEYFTACVGLLQTGKLCGNVAADKIYANILLRAMRIWNLPCCVCHPLIFVVKFSRESASLDK